MLVVRLPRLFTRCPPHAADQQVNFLLGEVADTVKDACGKFDAEKTAGIVDEFGALITSNTEEEAKAGKSVFERGERRGAEDPKSFSEKDVVSIKVTLHPRKIHHCIHRLDIIPKSRRVLRLWKVQELVELPRRGGANLQLYGVEWTSLRSRGKGEKKKEDSKRKGKKKKKRKKDGIRGRDAKGYVLRQWTRSKEESAKQAEEKSPEVCQTGEESEGSDRELASEIDLNLKGDQMFGESHPGSSCRPLVPRGVSSSLESMQVRAHGRRAPKQRNGHLPSCATFARVASRKVRPPVCDHCQKLMAETQYLNENFG